MPQNEILQIAVECFQHFEIAGVNTTTLQPDDFEMLGFSTFVFYCF